jgi:plastocyanin
MKTQVRFLAILTVAAALQSASAGDITGTVSLKGTPPPEKDIALTPECGPVHKGPMKTRFYAVENGKLADVVVVVKGVKATSSGASAKPLVVDQVGCEYVPYVAAVQTGQKILARNSDPFMHNVHTLPSVPGNKEANKAQMAKSPDLEFAFEKPEQFLKFKCDVHPWMFSYVSVFDHPYFAVTGKDGSYKIANVPPGKYTLEAYHRKAAPADKPVTQEIEVKDQAVTADLTLEVK